MIRQHSVVSRHTAPCHKAHRRAGFTLVEILVVIAIIGILSAILFPVFRSARESARRTSCQSNLKQLGIGFQQYTKDYGEYYPYAGNFQSWGSPSAHWVTGPANGTALAKITANAEGDFEWTGEAAKTSVGGISNYLKNTEVYICPSTEFGEEKQLTYSMNCAVSGILGARIKQPASIVLLVDEAQTLNDGFFFAADTNDPGSFGQSTDTATQEHGGANLLFADGHVKSYPPDSLALDKSPAGLDNKGRITGDVRFHDVSFGSPRGNALTGFLDGTQRDLTKDSCLQPLTAAPPTTP